jgi:hypothetical protein
MEITSTTLILVGVICIVLGFFASVLLNTLRDDESQPIEEDVQAPPGGKKGRYTAIVRLWRENKSGALIVESGGRSFVSATPLNDAQREEMERSAREFRGWLGMGLANNPATGEVQGRLEQVSAQSVVPTSAASSPIVANTPMAAAVSVQRKQVVPASAAAASVQPAVVMSAKSIVMQIEDILQDMIASGPLTNRGIHLYEDPLRGVMVSVGSEKFEGIDSVPDPVIKSTIRAAVAEWEKGQ